MPKGTQSNGSLSGAFDYKNTEHGLDMTPNWISPEDVLKTNPMPLHNPYKAIVWCPCLLRVM